MWSLANTWTSRLSPAPRPGLCHGILAALRTTKPACVWPWGVGEAAAKGWAQQCASQLPCVGGVLLSHVPPSACSGLGKRPVEPSVSAAPLPPTPSLRNRSKWRRVKRFSCLESRRSPAYFKLRIRALARASVSPELRIRSHAWQAADQT